MTRLWPCEASVPTVKLPTFNRCLERCAGHNWQGPHGCHKLEIYGLYNPGWWAFQKVIWVEAKKKLVSFVLLFCIWNKTSFEVMTTFLGFTKWMKAEYVEWRWSEVAIFLLNLFGVTSEKQGRCPQHNMNPSKPKGFSPISIKCFLFFNKNCWIFWHTLFIN